MHLERIVVEETGRRPLRRLQVTGFQRKPLRFDLGPDPDSAEVATALLRHATSKLPDGGGLAAVATLGFRGEGLASVAAVARTTVSSRMAGDEIATAVDAFGESVARLIRQDNLLGLLQ